MSTAVKIFPFELRIQFLLMTTMHGSALLFLGNSMCFSPGLPGCYLWTFTQLSLLGSLAPGHGSILQGNFPCLPTLCTSFLNASKSPRWLPCSVSHQDVTSCFPCCSFSPVLTMPVGTRNICIYHGNSCILCIYSECTRRFDISASMNHFCFPKYNFSLCRLALESHHFVTDS